jgi:Phosphate-starvation-inducible E family
VPWFYLPPVLPTSCKASLAGHSRRASPCCSIGSLLILLIVELLYTVQVSFREHAIVPEPFLIIGLIAAIRRVLVLTAELGEMRSNDLVLKYFLIEISALTVLILVLVAALVLLRRLTRPLPSVRHLLERQFARYFDIIANRLYAHLTCQGCRATPSTDSPSA